MTMPSGEWPRKGNGKMADSGSFLSQIDPSALASMVGQRSVTRIGGAFIMQHRWLTILAVTLIIGVARAIPGVAQTERGPYARIAIMRAIDGHAVEWEEGYIRHLEWHRRVKDPFNWY